MDRKSTKLISFATFLGSLAAAALAAGSPISSATKRTRRGNAPKGYRTIHRLNRSQNWRPARSYEETRAMSPYPDRPVR